MTERSFVQAAHKRVVASVAPRLKQAGFVRSGNTFRKIAGENAAMIGFQASRSNTAIKVKFTVNLAIVCYGLQLFDTPLGKADIYDGQLMQRIGDFLPDPYDKWWEITETTNIAPIIAEVTSLIFDKGLPFLLPYLDTDALIALWESGESPGINDFKRLRYLGLIKARAESDRAPQ